MRSVEPAGRRVKGEMQDKYGASKGKAVFAGKAAKDPRFAKAMKGPSSRKLGRR